MEHDTKECPYCGELIIQEALKCRWCGELMPDAPPHRRGPRPVSRGSREQPEGASTILVFGILGWFLCFIFGIVAWVKGNEYEQECRNRGITPDGMATAGKLIGMVVTILAIVGIGIGVLVIGVAGASGGF